MSTEPTKFAGPKDLGTRAVAKHTPRDHLQSYKWPKLNPDPSSAQQPKRDQIYLGVTHNGPRWAPIAAVVCFDRPKCLEKAHFLVGYSHTFPHLAGI